MKNNYNYLMEVDFGFGDDDLENLIEMEQEENDNLILNDLNDYQAQTSQTNMNKVAFKTNKKKKHMKINLK